MGGRQGPETRLIKKMKDAGRKRYGASLVVIKYHGSSFSEAGVSDLLCCLMGVFVAVEVKAPESYGGSEERALAEGPTLKQIAFLQRVNDADGIGVVCASVEAFLETLSLAEDEAMRRVGY
jgi:hypothetical protein